MDFEDNYPIVQYADDTLVILPACARQLHCLKGLLHTFALSTGLKVNYHKSSIIPINVPEEKVPLLAGVFGCQVGSMPFTYLGLPLDTTRPTVQDFSPLVDRVERRLTSSASFLSYGGGLTLINSFFSHLPTSPQDSN